MDFYVQINTYTIIRHDWHCNSVEVDKPVMIYLKQKAQA